MLDTASSGLIQILNLSSYFPMMIRERTDPKDMVWENLINWEQANPKPYPSALLELISLDDVPPPSNVLDVPVGLLENKPSGPLPQGSGLFLLSELIIPNDASPFSKTMEIPVKVSPKNSVDVIGTRDIGHTSVIKHEEVPRWISTTVADFKTDRTLTDTAPSISNEQKFLVLQKSPSLEGNYTGYESLDGISVGEIEGESIVDRLKRHDEYDRRCMHEFIIQGIRGRKKCF
ncbi:hypothetical protein U1Q18_016689 [Sarracenia purpurea var. burkii]